MKLLKQLANSKSSLNAVISSSKLIEIDDTLRKKLQRVLLEMYTDVFQVCNMYGIEIFLVGGSALGAVRHQGFIPWDDDLDIGMKREDYRKFMKIFEKELSEKYILNAPNYHKTDSITRFPKILKKGTYLEGIGDIKKKELQRVFLDIFILDNVPSNKMFRTFKGLYCNLLEFIGGVVFTYENASAEDWKVYAKGGSASARIRKMLGWLFSFRSASKWNNSIDKAIQYSKRTKYVGLPTGRKHYFGEMIERDRVFPLRKASFENETVFLFSDVENYLTNLYGNFMEVPPENKREKHFIKNIKL